MASLPILRYSLLILVFFSFISSSLARPFWIFIYFLFFPSPGHFFGMEAWPAPRGGQGTVIGCDMMRLMN